MVSLLAGRANAQRPAAIRASAFVVQPAMDVRLEADTAQTRAGELPPRRLVVRAAPGVQTRVTAVDPRTVRLNVEYLGS